MSSGFAPVIRTRAGLVRGVQYEDYAAYLGIPFAEAPVGPLRFEAPRPRAPWDGVRDAAAYGPTSQRGARSGNIIPEPSIPGEDIFTVNVFTPAANDPAAKLPVVAWIHGGAYLIGSPASPWYHGRTFAQNGVILVSLPYRLGFEGFGLVPDAPANRGALDWIAGLEWIRDNISAFGGDPDNVTLAGQSAGGGALLHLMTMPRAEGLFHKAWALSPMPGDSPIGTARELAQRMAKKLKVPFSRAGFEGATVPHIRVLQQHVANPPLRLIRNARAALRAGLPWSPVVDGEVIPESTSDAFARGLGAHIPLVTTTTNDEFTAAANSSKLRYIPPFIATRLAGVPMKEARSYFRARGRDGFIGHFLTDYFFRAPAAERTVARGAHNAQSWLGAIAWPSPSYGSALHCIDIPFWFGVPDALGASAVIGENPPPLLTEALHGGIVSFARSGAPGWDAWTPQNLLTRVFDGDTVRNARRAYENALPLMKNAAHASQHLRDD